MDIAGVSTQLSSNRMLNDVGTAVLGKSLDQSKNAGSALVGMINSSGMEKSVNPAVGSNFDMSV